MLKSLKTKFQLMDKWLLFLTVALSVFGLFNIVTASSREAVVGMDQSVYYYFYRHLIVLIAGLVAFFIIIHVETEKYYRWIPLLYLGILGLNIYVIINGKLTRGALNWLDLGFFNLQPSEFAKPIIVVALALYLEKFGKRLHNKKVKHAPLIVCFCALGLLIPALVFFQKDVGTMAIQLAIFGVMYLLSPILWKEKWKVVGYLAVIARFNYLNPCSPEKYKKKGYQVCNAYIAINLGGLDGVGIGKSTQKYSYIPEAHTDMVFAIFAEEYGFLAGALVILLYGVIIYHILMLSSKASTIRGKYICLGVATYLFAHIFINLGGMFGLIHS